MADIRLERTGDAAVLTIDRPGTRNAISRAVMDELSEALDEIAMSDTRALAIRGAGDRVFVSGGDLKDLAEIRGHDEARGMALRMRGLLDQLASLPIPVVAALNGHAFGGGCETAVACDFRIAASDVRLAFNQVDLAITPAWGGIERLQSLVGRARALYLMTTGYAIDADTARAWGLVEEVTSRDAFDARLGELLERIARAPRPVLTAIKGAAARSQPPIRPDLAGPAAEDFARTWTADTHWRAVAQDSTRRRVNTVGLPPAAVTSRRSHSQPTQEPAMTSGNMPSESQSRLVGDINARIDRLPRFPMPAGTLVLMAIFYFFSYYDITVIGEALPSITTQFHLTTSQTALPVTLNLAGYVVGAYAFGSLADYLGRRRALLITLAVLSAGALLTAFSWDITSLSVFRLIVGVGTGAQISLAATYMAEITPARLRGRFTQFNIIWAAVGLGAAPWVALPLVGLGDVGWRVMLGLGAVAAVVALFVRSLPESPRWLAVHGHPRAAEAIVAGMEARTRHSVPGGQLPPVTGSNAEEHAHGFPTMALFRRPYLSRLLIVLGFWIVWYIPTYSILGYEPVLLKNIGVSAPNSLLFTALGDVAFPVGAVITWLLMDHVERKWIIAAVMVVYTAAMLTLGLATGSGVVVTGALLFALCVLAGSGTGYIYTSEIFPTRARASAMSIGDGIGHVGGVVAPYITLGALAVWGGRGTFLLLAALAFCGLLLIGAGGVATTGRTLTQLAGGRARGVTHRTVGVNERRSP